MVAGRTAEANIRTRWEVEIFPFESVYPDTTESGPQASTSAVVDIGITSLRISRTKASPSGQCTFAIIGEVPPGCFPGSWVTVSSISQAKDGSERRLMRFIGQIYDMASDYVTAPDNSVVQTKTMFSVREWSSMLEMPVRYDLFAIIQSLPAANALTGAANFALSAGGNQPLSADELQKIALQSFNAYELAHLILTLIGAIGQNDKINSIDALGAIGLPEVSVRMPSVPKSLLTRLGLDTVSAVNPFTSGLADVITGVQKDAVNADGQWDGIFGSPTSSTTTSLSQVPGFNVFEEVTETVTAASPSIEQYKSGFEKNPENRPIALGMAALASTGGSAWELITQHCDPALNEFYTDILYQKLPSGDVVAKPAIFVRDKPFLMRRFKGTVASGLGPWTVYDDLPRVRIDTVFIDRFRFRNTFQNSPNFIRVNFQPQAVDAELAKVYSQVAGALQQKPEMNRFGGQEHFVETQFLSLDVINGRNKENPLANWFKEVVTISSCWHSYNYRMGSGTISLKDDNIPITCGFNVQFKIGEFEVVGHVDAFEVAFNVHPDGRYETTSTVQLSRIVHDFEGQLEFIPPDSMANLLYTIPSKVDDPPIFLSSLSGVAGSLSDLVGAILPAGLA